jgi:hypothetical protein
MGAAVYGFVYFSVIVVSGLNYKSVIVHVIEKYTTYYCASLTLACNTFVYFSIT